MALALTQMTSLLEEPRLSVVIAKNTLRPEDHHHLNAVETDDFYDNIIHFIMESALCAYMAKEWDKALRREFGAQETDKNLLQEKCLKLKGQVEEVENTMRETLKFIDKLQADLDEANTSKAFKNLAKTAEDQVAILCQVQSCSLMHRRPGPPQTGWQNWKMDFKRRQPRAERCLSKVRRTL